jgi:hypothetical protein
LNLNMNLFTLDNNKKYSFICNNNWIFKI